MDSQTKIYFENLLTQVAENKILGLHLSAGNPPVFKVATGLAPQEQEPVLTKEVIKDFLFSFLDKAAQVKLEKERDLTVVHNFKPQLRFKVNIFYQKDNLSASLRPIPAQTKTLAELNLETVEKIFHQFQRGVIIISGPFSSGKSTVLAGLLETVNLSASKHIITLEDPIEFIFANKKSLIEQRELGRDVRNYQEGLDFLAQEQVDIVALSELAEPEVLKAAFKLAQSGRLVVFQINADSAVKTLEKIIALFESKDQSTILDLLSENLRAVFNLHLIKKTGGGNIIAPEILISNSAVRSLVREGKIAQLQNILQTGSSEGMVPLEKSLRDLVNAGIISPEEAQSV